MPQTLGGSLFIHNAIRYGYCLIEALESLYALCDEISVIECQSDDGTAELLRKWVEGKGSEKKIHVEYGHLWQVTGDYSRLAILANKAKDRLTTDWHFMLQADEVIHESSFPLIRELIERPASGYYCRRLNLFRSPDLHVRLDSKKKPCGDVVCRLARRGFPALLDAESLAVDAALDRNHTDRIVIFHYGYVREGDLLIAKAMDMLSWFFGPHSTVDQRIVKMRDEGNVFRPEVYFSPDDVCPIPIPHPVFSKDYAARLRRPPMIYDGFIFYNELELLEIRLNELDHLVDRFILVEADVTFSGRKKPLVFQENKHLFERFLPKIAHVVVSDMPGGNDPWVKEQFQRNAIARGIPKDAKDTDLLIVADVDEIPKAETVAKALPISSPKALDMGAYSGYLNVLWGGWSHAKICPVATLRTSDPQTIRHQGHDHIQDAGWHFSYLGGPERVCEKLTAFAHQEPSVQKYNNLGAMREAFKAGAGVFGGVNTYLELDGRFPKYVLENREKFKHLIGPPSSG